MDLSVLLGPWKMGTIQMALQINQKLLKHNKTWEDVESYIEDSRQSGPLQTSKQVFTAALCPQCKNPMGLFSVNNQPGNQVGGSYKSQWYCVLCDLSTFSHESVGEEYERLIRVGTMGQQDVQISPTVAPRRRIHYDRRGK